jgi:hypothetical protein
MSRDDYAFPQHLVRGLGALPEARRAPQAHQVPKAPLVPSGVVSWPWANWDPAMGAWWWGGSPSTPPSDSPQGIAQGQWIRLTNSDGTGVWVWYPMPAGVPQLLGPGAGPTAVTGPTAVPGSAVGLSSIAYAVWSTFKPKFVDAKDWIQTAPNYWIAPDAWKQYILNNLIPGGVVDTASTPSGASSGSPAPAR